MSRKMKEQGQCLSLRARFLSVRRANGEERRPGKASLPNLYKTNGGIFSSDDRFRSSSKLTASSSATIRRFLELRRSGKASLLPFPNINGGAFSELRPSSETSLLPFPNINGGAFSELRPSSETSLLPFPKINGGAFSELCPSSETSLLPFPKINGGAFLSEVRSRSTA